MMISILRFQFVPIGLILIYSVNAFHLYYPNISRSFKYQTHQKNCDSHNLLKFMNHERGIRTSLNFFGKIFEEEGPLGKGITVGKVQVALSCSDRSLISTLESKSKNSGDSPQDLSRLGNAVCLALLRKSDDFIAACSESQWFGAADAAKAESLHNTWSNNEAAKFEKEYVTSADGKEKVGGPTIIVVSLIVEIQGDETNFEGAGYSLSKTKDVLSSIAADCMVDEGYCLNAIEIFWTPGDREEVLTKNDLILDFPTLIDL